MKLDKLSKEELLLQINKLSIADDIVSMMVNGGLNFVNGINTCVVVYNKDTKVIFCNEYALDIFGLNQNKICKFSINDFEGGFQKINGDYININEYSIEKIMNSKKIISNLVVKYKKNNKSNDRWLLLNGCTVLDKWGMVSKVIFNFNDITSQYSNVNSMLKNDIVISNIINLAPIGISIINENGTYENINYEYCKLFGYDKGELVGKHFSIVSCENNKESLVKVHNKLIKSGMNLKGEWQLKKKDGTEIFVLADGIRYMDSNSGYKRITSIIDFTNKKKIEFELMRKNELLEEISKNDGLTELLNHNGIFLELETQIDITKKNDICLSIIMLDLDHFKEINDENGHLVGDEVLVKVADVIRKSIRSKDIAGRYGGEEFLIILPDADMEKAFYIAEKIRKNISQLIFDVNLKVTASGGVKQYENESVFNFVRNADILLYKAKINGRNRIEK